MIDRDNIYLVGVGGIGMSALARYFKQIGKNVAGYDRSITDLTKRLQSEEINVTCFSEADAIPVSFRDKENTLVIYTPAISESNSILSFFREEGFDIKKRAEVLGILSRRFKTIAVAGTHGKTTVSSMIAFLLRDNNIEINAFLGGISRDFGTNLLLNPDAEIMVTEADEYDRSFLQLNPNQLIVTSIDADHLDIYEDEEDLYNTYSLLVEQVHKDGVLITKPFVTQKLTIPADLTVKHYSLSENTQVEAKNLRVENGDFVFDYTSDRLSIKNIKCGLPGLHNVENALAAITVAHEYGVTAEKIKNSIGKFQGVKRRFDVHLKTDDFVYIDDYAHHPQEIKMLLSSVRELYPNKKITTVFQPHLFSRTRDFGEDFARELALSDELILLEIYPAREDPIEGINALWLSKQIGKNDVPVCEKHQLMNILKTREVELLLTVGAGDIDTMIDPIINYYAVEE